MKEYEYYIEIENYIKRNEVNKRRRILEENYENLNNFWNIGRLIVEAQGGKENIKQGDELIKNGVLSIVLIMGKVIVMQIWLDLDNFI